MEMEELTIDFLKEKGGCFLVKLLDFEFDHDILFEYLETEKYSKIPYRTSLPRGPWLYINIVTKTYRYGTVGVGIVTEVIGNHAISVDDFITINNIYKKYEGLSFLYIK